MIKCIYEEDGKVLFNKNLQAIFSIGISEYEENVGGFVSSFAHGGMDLYDHILVMGSHLIQGNLLKEHLIKEIGKWFDEHSEIKFLNRNDIVDDIVRNVLIDVVTFLQYEEAKTRDYFKLINDSLLKNYNMAIEKYNIGRM